MESIKVLWKLEYLKAEGDTTPTLGYVDFQIEGIDGVFRAANSDGVDLEKVVFRIEQNRQFFQYAVEAGISKVFEESVTEANWGNGWEWQETSHPRQAKGFRLTGCTSWFTCPFGDKRPEVVSMERLHNIQSSGIKLLYSWNANRRPSEVCYFFPFSVVAAPVG